MTLNVAEPAPTPKSAGGPQLPPRHAAPTAAATGARLDVPPRRLRSAQGTGMRPRARRAVAGGAGGVGARAPAGAGGDSGAQRPRWSTDSADSLLSNSSGASEGSASPELTVAPCRLARQFQPPPPHLPSYRAMLLGEPGVGKSTLARIFGGVEDDYDADFAVEDYYQRSVVVDGEETTLALLEFCGQAGEEWLDDELAHAGDAYIIVYSIAERASFERAAEMRIQVRKARQADDVPIILVGNKSDLVRSREVSVDEGRACAAVFDCKFIETSAALQHNVRELYHGVVRQLRLRRRRGDLERERRDEAGRLLRPSGLLSSSSCASASSSSASSSSSSSSSAGSAPSSAGAVSSSACPRHHPSCHHHRYARRKESLTKRAWRILSRFMVARGAGRLAFRVKSKSCHDLSVL
uniref:GTP-binding protein RAD-like n=1 Tax=Petromyzon marinus TaxID=7757 RepID=A0AAJ7T8X4_PETMA|nr:GTP-binding protein RAD-like [Petromyzon marinus]